MSNNADILIGKTLGNCTLEKLVGRGGMSAVYHARQTRPSRFVAVKVMLPNISMRSNVYNEFLARFQREADVIAQLEHINIIPIHAYGEEERLAYLVMPYLSHGSLENVLTQQSALSLQETILYINQAASALDYAHARGIIHRDLKPANFLLHADGRLILADFGIARMMQDASTPQGPTLTLSGSVLGTPSYMAPEMTLGKQIDSRADIYELGIVIFQMLSGEVPFKGTNFFEVTQQHLNSPLPSLHHINPAIPPAIDDVLQKAAAKRPEDRYSSAGALAQALCTAMTKPELASKKFFSQPTEYVPPTRQRNLLPPAPQVPMPVQETKRRKRLWPLLAGIFIIVLAVGGIFSNLLIFGPQPQVSAQETQAVQSTIRDFYDNINNRDYPAAYFLLRTDYQNSTDYCQFLSDYPQTNHYQIISYGSITKLSDGTLNVPTTIQSGAGSSYLRVYTVEQKNNIGKIVAGSPSENGTCTLPTQRVLSTTSPSTATQQAEAVINQYYNDINIRDYGSAYYLRKFNLQHPCLDNCINDNSYRAFVNGYAKTESVDITINRATLNADGTVDIEITINATEMSITGRNKTSFHNVPYHFVQLQNGVWEIAR